MAAVPPVPAERDLRRGAGDPELKNTGPELSS
jgi:hypothetical protein